jgi:hypothetical protein
MLCPFIIFYVRFVFFPFWYIASFSFLCNYYEVIRAMTWTATSLATIFETNMFPRRYAYALFCSIKLWGICKSWPHVAMTLQLWGSQYLSEWSWFECRNDFAIMELAIFVRMQLVRMSQWLCNYGARYVRPTAISSNVPRLFEATYSFFKLKKLTLYTLAGIDLTTHSSSLLDDTTMYVDHAARARVKL